MYGVRLNTVPVYVPSTTALKYIFVLDCTVSSRVSYVSGNKRVSPPKNIMPLMFVIEVRLDFLT
jgi:hypothetical protein